MTDHLMVYGLRERAEMKREATAAKRVRALELLAEGHAIQAVALAVGRPRNVVATWRREAQGVIQG
jgi:hypothetical protein